MITVHKYPLKLNDYDYIDMPEGAEVLKVGMQHDRLYIWAKVDPDRPAEERRFRVAVTGHPLGDVRCEHIDTVITANNFVWHIFEVEE